MKSRPTVDAEPAGQTPDPAVPDPADEMIEISHLEFLHLCSVLGLHSRTEVVSTHYSVPFRLRLALDGPFSGSIWDDRVESSWGQSQAASAPDSSLSDFQEGETTRYGTFD